MREKLNAGFFGSNLKLLRTKKKLSQRKLSSILGCSHTTIPRWENKNDKPNGIYIKKILNFFQVNERVMFDLNLKRVKQPQSLTQTSQEQPAVIQDKKQTHQETYHQILDEAKEIHNRKNHDYAGREEALFNLTMCEKMGISAFKGTCVRLTDKFCRIISYCNSGKIKSTDEKIEDTLIDIINYSAFAIEFHRKERRKAKSGV